MPKSSNWFSIQARANSPVEIFIFDVIGAGFFENDGLTAKQFVEALAPHAGRDLTVRVNSPGGNLFGGLAIANALKAHTGFVETRVEGLAASIASVIALSGKKVTMAESSMMMIHNPTALASGDSNVMRESAAALDKMAGQLAGIYAARTGKPQAEVLAAMDKTTWFTANEAKDWGLVDEISAPLKAAACFNLASFANVPTALANRPNDITAMQKEIGEMRTKLDSVQMAHAKNVVRLLLQEQEAGDMLRQNLVNEFIQDPEKTETKIRTMISNGSIPRYGAEPVSSQSSDLLLGIEDAHTSYVARLNKFKNVKK